MTAIATEEKEPILSDTLNWDVKDLADEIFHTLSKEEYIQFLICVGIVNNEGE